MRGEGLSERAWTISAASMCRMRWPPKDSMPFSSVVLLPVLLAANLFLLFGRCSEQQCLAAKLMAVNQGRCVLCLPACHSGTTTPPINYLGKVSNGGMEVSVLRVYRLE